MKRACVIGWPIAHSRSPIIHGYWLEQHRINGRYTKVPVKPEDVDAFVAGLAANGYAGCNVTVPHKEQVFGLVGKLGGRLHGAAMDVGAANTLWLDTDGQLNATSTDAMGFMAHLGQSVPGLSLAGKTVAVLGAGGAALSVVRALKAAGAREIRIANRSPERAAALAGQVSGGVAVPWAERSAALEGCVLAVNTTTLGMTGQPPLDIDLSAMPKGGVVYDIVYVPLETPLLAQARARGLNAVDGLGMLLHQAVPGFEAWFGTRPVVTPELRALVVADIEGR